MEPEVREFFKRVGYTIGLAFSWLAITCIAAIRGDSAFIGNHVTISNVLFYLWVIVSMIALIFIYKKMWSK
jgi:hypothetical protein